MKIIILHLPVLKFCTVLEHEYSIQNIHLVNEKKNTLMLLTAAFIWFIIAAFLFEVTRSDRGDQGAAVQQNPQRGPANFYPQGPVISPDGHYYWDPVRNRWIRLQSNIWGNLLIGMITTLIVALCAYYWYTLL